MKRKTFERVALAQNKLDDVIMEIQCAVNDGETDIKTVRRLAERATVLSQKAVDALCTLEEEGFDV